ncbi:Pc16g01950 [Penicillium rubens Wisconsin 54-1255]|jgi:hypothetical protein|uniref:Pc16g01950 protein n=1 Tax=Penicillium rubens (strain ATCC 28089 / DSM 1075 / NRRL 1951 / Wisconsin 54-1255) TaxID=500485 RepID=B6H7A1_PENRW|nr:Pc16g01950 [Penicillium rubens Wisconsin 54-1255]
MQIIHGKGEERHFKVTHELSQPYRLYNIVHDPSHLTQITIFDPKVPLREETRSQPDQFVAIISENGAKGELDTSHTSPWNRQVASEGNNENVGERKDLCFVPYYLRADRGGRGRGQMRVSVLSTE